MNPEELKNIDLEQLIIDDLIKQLKQITMIVVVFSITFASLINN